MMIVPGQHDHDEETEFGRRVTIQSPVLPLSGGYRVIAKTREVRSILTGFQPDALEVSDRTTLRGLGKWAFERDIPAVFIAHERADGILRANLAPLLAKAMPIEGIADAHNRKIHRLFATVVATTDYAAREFARIGVPAVKVPLGVDLKRFHPDKADPELRAEYAADDEVLLLMASRLSPEKRPDLAIDAVRVLASRGRNVRLVCAGTGSIERDVRERAAGAPVSFMGFVSSRARFAQLLASADVVIAPGPIETFGLAALEGLASGTPAVVNQNSALPEVVGDAGIAAASTPEAFADAIELMLTRDTGDRRVAARAQAETLPWSATVERMLALHRGASAEEATD
jgi:alpha-1,6-mannosyltransferase